MKLADRVRTNSQLTLLLDCNGMCHALRHTMGGLSHDGQESGIIYGFLMQLLALRKRFHPRLFVFAWDSRASLRKQISKEYKANRSASYNHDEEESRRQAFRQFDLLREEILPELGLGGWSLQVDGHEADDIIADIALCLKAKKVIVSQDHDLYQLLSEDCTMYSTKTRSQYTHRDFKEEYGISPERWAEVKAIAGCPGDNVIGVPGVGEWTAIKYLNGELPRGRKYVLIGLHREQITLNRRLVQLPLDRGPVVPWSVMAKWDSSRSEVSENGFRLVCERYGLDSFLEPERYRQWAEAFRWGRL